MKNEIAFAVWGRFALFTDPITKIGGEKCSYHVPTYEALRGIASSIYWKPTFVWKIDKVRVVKPIRTQTKGMKPLNYQGGKAPNTLAYYNYLFDVEYHVLAHFEWNKYAFELECDRNDAKHYEMLQRYMKRGGRRDIFLGTRECQGYVRPIEWSEEPEGHYKDADEISFGLMFHSFLYPEESGEEKLFSRFWYPKMRYGEIDFSAPEAKLLSKFVRPMKPVRFVNKLNYSSSEFDNGGVAAL